MPNKPETHAENQYKPYSASYAEQALQHEEQRVSDSGFSGLSPLVLNKNLGVDTAHLQEVGAAPGSINITSSLVYAALRPAVPRSIYEVDNVSVRAASTAVRTTVSPGIASAAKRAAMAVAPSAKRKLHTPEGTSKTMRTSSSQDLVCAQQLNMTNVWTTSLPVMPVSASISVSSDSSVRTILSSDTRKAANARASTARLAPIQPRPLRLPVHTRVSQITQTYMPASSMVSLLPSQALALAHSQVNRATLPASTATISRSTPVSHTAVYSQSRPMFSQANTTGQHARSSSAQGAEVHVPMQSQTCENYPRITQVLLQSYPSMRIQDTQRPAAVLVQPQSSFTGNSHQYANMSNMPIIVLTDKDQLPAQLAPTQPISTCAATTQIPAQHTLVNNAVSADGIYIETRLPPVSHQPRIVDIVEERAAFNMPVAHSIVTERGLGQQASVHAPQIIAQNIMSTVGKAVYTHESAVTNVANCLPSTQTSVTSVLAPAPQLSGDANSTLCIPSGHEMSERILDIVRDSLSTESAHDTRVAFVSAKTFIKSLSHDELESVYVMQYARKASSSQPRRFQHALVVPVESNDRLRDAFNKATCMVDSSRHVASTKSAQVTNTSLAMSLSPARTTYTPSTSVACTVEQRAPHTASQATQKEQGYITTADGHDFELMYQCTIKQEANVEDDTQTKLDSQFDAQKNTQDTEQLQSAIKQEDGDTEACDTLTKEKKDVDSDNSQRNIDSDSVNVSANTAVHTVLTIEDKSIDAQSAETCTTIASTQNAKGADSVDIAANTVVSTDDTGVTNITTTAGVTSTAITNETLMQYSIGATNTDECSLSDSADELTIDLHESDDEQSSQVVHDQGGVSIGTQVHNTQTTRSPSVSSSAVNEIPTIKKSEQLEKKNNINTKRRGSKFTYRSPTARKRLIRGYAFSPTGHTIGQPVSLALLSEYVQTFVPSMECGNESQCNACSLLCEQTTSYSNKSQWLQNLSPFLTAYSEICYKVMALAACSFDVLKLRCTIAHDKYLLIAKQSLMTEVSALGYMQSLTNTVTEFHELHMVAIRLQASNEGPEFKQSQAIHDINTTLLDKIDDHRKALYRHCLAIAVKQECLDRVKNDYGQSKILELFKLPQYQNDIVRTIDSFCSMHCVSRDKYYMKLSIERRVAQLCRIKALIVNTPDLFETLVNQLGMLSRYLILNHDDLNQASMVSQTCTDTNPFDDVIARMSVAASHIGNVCVLGTTLDGKTSVMRFLDPLCDSKSRTGATRTESTKNIVYDVAESCRAKLKYIHTLYSYILLELGHPGNAVVEDVLKTLKEDDPKERLFSKQTAINVAYKALIHTLSSIGFNSIDYRPDRRIYKHFTLEHVLQHVAILNIAEEAMAQTFCIFEDISCELHKHFMHVLFNICANIFVDPVKEVYATAIQQLQTQLSYRTHEFIKTMFVYRLSRLHKTCDYESYYTNTIESECFACQIAKAGHYDDGTCISVQLIQIGLDALSSLMPNTRHVIDAYSASFVASGSAQRFIHMLTQDILFKAVLLPCTQTTGSELETYLLLFREKHITQK